MICVTGIQRLVLAGRMGEAIDPTYDLYPGILETKPDLLFKLTIGDLEVVKEGST